MAGGSVPAEQLVFQVTKIDVPTDATADARVDAQLQQQLRMTCCSNISRRCRKRSA